MHLLFLCSRNKWRSRTAETIFKDNGHHMVRSAGTARTARVRLTQSLVDWADVIYAMEDRHRRYVLQNFRGATDYVHRGAGNSGRVPVFG